MKRAFLHIGHPKTASTYLQHVMTLSHDVLREGGVVVPCDFRSVGSYDFLALSRRGHTHSGNATEFFFAIEESRFEPADFRPLLETGNRDLLLSSELLFYHVATIEALTRFLAELGFETHVIAYIGSYADMAVKAYCQNIRNARFTGSLTDYLRNPTPKTFLQLGDVFERLTGMPSIASVTFRPFHPDFLKGGDVVQDFFGIVAPRIDSGTLVRPANGANATLPLAVLEQLRVVNHDASEAELASLRNSASDNTAEGRRRIMDHYYTREAKQLINELFGADRARFLQSMPSQWRTFWSVDPDPRG